MAKTNINCITKIILLFTLFSILRKTGQFTGNDMRVCIDGLLCPKVKFNMEEYESALELKSSDSESQPEIINPWHKVCLCDFNCKENDNCCTDSDFIIGQQGTCKYIQGFGYVYTINKCPKDWPNDKTRENCEEIPQTDEDPIRKIPVTDNYSGITYANLFCATCHLNGSLKNLSYWSLEFRCSNKVINKEKYNAIYDKNFGKWGYRTKAEFNPCDLKISLSDEIYTNWPCFQVTHNCEENWSKTTSSNYTASVIGFPFYSLYITSDYSACNMSLLNDLACLHLEKTRSHLLMEGEEEERTSSFSVLFDFTLNTHSAGVGKKLICQNEMQLYDPFFHKCRDMIQKTQIDETESQGETQNTSTCSRFHLHSDEYIINSDNTSIYVKEYERNFSKNEFTMSESGYVTICAPFVTQTESKFSTAMQFVTYIGLGLSIIFLTIHLLVFCFCNEMRKISDKNLFSLSVALLCSYISFFVMSESEPPGTWCFIIGFTMYYTLMAYFSWSLTIAFDIWNTLRLATSKFKLSSGKQETKFLFCSLWSWLVPLVLLSIVCLLEYLSGKNVSKTLKPQIGKHSCWFGNRYALLMFVAIPCSIVMLFNIIFMCWSAYFIIVTKSRAKNVSSYNISLYIRLALIMGLTWSFGLAAGYFDLDILWYIFIVLNTLQGFFIFVAFTCRREVLAHVKKRFLNKGMYAKNTTTLSTLSDNVSKIRNNI